MHNRFNIDKLIAFYKEESTYETRGELNPVFIQSTAYEQAESKKVPVFYLLGQKGTGKSSIFNKVAHENSPNNLYVYFEKFYTLIEERVKQHRSNTKVDIPLSYAAYQREWEIILWIQIVRHLYFKYRRNKRFHLFDAGEYLGLFEFLDNNRLPVPLNLTSKIVRLPRNLKSIEVKNVKIEIAEEQYSSGASNIYHLEAVKDAVAKLLGATPIYLIVDELDHIPSLTQEIRYSILGLIQALGALVRDINSSVPKDPGLLVRMAIRKDMMEAVTQHYPSSQILHHEEIDPSWNNEQLEELVARRIRNYWELPPSAISRRKLLMEIWPAQLQKDQPTFEYLGRLSNNNPRALFLLINQVLQKAVNRKKTYIPDTDIPAISITVEDIRGTLADYSRSQLQNQHDGAYILYPGIDLLVNTLKTKCRTLFTEGLLFQQLATALENILKKEPVLKKQIESWQHRELTTVDRVIQVLYYLRYIGLKADEELVYYPKPLTQVHKLFFHPVYCWDLLKIEPPMIETDNRQGFRDAWAFVDRSVNSFLKEDVGSFRTTKISSSSGREKSDYEEINIAYGFLRCLWSVRHLMKSIASVGGTIGLQATKAQTFLAELDDIFYKLAELVGSNADTMHLATILLNSTSSNSCSERLIFVKEMEASENQEIFLQCTEALLTWIHPLKENSSTHVLLEMQLAGNKREEEELAAQIENPGTDSTLVARKIKDLEKNRAKMTQRLAENEAERETMVAPLERIFDRLTALCRLLESEELHD